MKAVVRENLLCLHTLDCGMQNPDRFGLGVRDEPMFPLWKYR